MMPAWRSRYVLLVTIARRAENKFSTLTVSSQLDTVNIRDLTVLRGVHSMEWAAYAYTYSSTSILNTFSNIARPEKKSGSLCRKVLLRDSRFLLVKKRWKRFQFDAIEISWWFESEIACRSLTIRSTKHNFLLYGVCRVSKFTRYCLKYVCATAINANRTSYGVYRYRMLPWDPERLNWTSHVSLLRSIVSLAPNLINRTRNAVYDYRSTVAQTVPRFVPRKIVAMLTRHG